MTEMGLARALGKVTSGIFVVTARRGSDEAALLASWIQQASFQPPTISIAIHKNRTMEKLLQENGAFVVNVLGDEKELYKHFVKGFGPDEKPFDGIRIKDSPSGMPILLDAISALDCRVRTRVDAGDHFLIVADVLDGELLKDEEPRVHTRKNGLSY